MLFQLTYKSEVEPDLDILDIQNILNTARTFNASENITGCLIYTTANFIQILEGERGVVRDLFERIQKDDRHFNVQLIDEGAAEHRSFPNWAMAYLKPADILSGPRSEEVVRDLRKINIDSPKPGLELETFWQNVGILLTDVGYYQN